MLQEAVRDSFRKNLGHPQTHAPAANAMETIAQRLEDTGGLATPGELDILRRVFANDVIPKPETQVLGQHMRGAWDDFMKGLTPDDTCCRVARRPLSR